MDVCFFLYIALMTISAGKQQTYDAYKTQNALYYAYGAYCIASELSRWSCKWCNYLHNFTMASDGVIFDDKLQAYIGYDLYLQSIVVAFRGAVQSIENWMDDFNTTQTLYHLPDAHYLSDPYIHSESFDSWKQLTGLGLTTKLESMFIQYPGSDVVLTGHSTGAVLAQITALELKLSPSYKIGAVHVITFGSPRWCTESVAKYFNDTLDSNWRIVNKNDIVPTIPYVNMGDYGYHHTSIQIRYTDYETSTYTQCDENGEDISCAYIGYSMDDHLEYFGLHQDCATSDMKPWSTMDDSVTNGSTNGDESNDEIEIIYKFKKAATAGLSTISKIALSIALVIGYLLCILFCCCWYATRKQLTLVRNRGAAAYVQLNESTDTDF